jgi:hypothetical protein
MSTHAHLRLVRSGGLAGIATEAEIDTADIDPREADEVLAGLDSVDLWSLARRPPAPPGPPDAFRYVLEVERGDAQHRIALAEAEIPPALRPVLAVLSRRARPARRVDREEPRE